METTTSTAPRDAYVTGMDGLLSADAGIVAAFEQAVAANEGFALAHLGLARTLAATRSATGHQQ